MRSGGYSRAVLLLPALLALTVSSAAPTAAAPTAAAADSGRVVVTPLQAQRNVDDGLVTMLGEVMLTELSSHGHAVVGYSDIKAMLDNEAAKAIVDCDGTTCLAELGDAMGARYLLHSSLGRIGGQYVINLKLIDVEKSAVKNRITRQVDANDEAGLIQAIREGVAELMQDRVSAPPPVASSGNALPLGLGIAGAVLGLAGAGTGVAFGVMTVTDVKFAPADPSYPASVAQARQNALISTVGWVVGVGGVGVVVAAAGFGLMIME